jgi:hypothetical protein
MTHRILIGGCSRSGTTFLQGLLARHPRIFTFPETGVFLKALGMRGTLLPWARIGLTLGKERKALAKLLDRVAQELPPWAAPPPPPPPPRPGAGGGGGGGGGGGAAAPPPPPPPPPP